ncbi:MAG: hypothetical protein L6Q29_01390 [Candidatus Pacebacteria bacterium]|nr:hypothetical protein [Candidatus Paceibacterota bacterium]NUQ57236.1 LOG family protein [Candidatus Paceibacter sp.]
MNETRHPHLKIKICVSGAAETGHCGMDALELGQDVGKEIVSQGAVLVTGATTGFPFWSAKGAKEAGGVSIGISPAETEKEHVEKYGLPLEFMDLIIFTGTGYAGRNLLLTRSTDAVIVGCGRIGTLNEFTIAFEDNKPIGVLQGDWETDELIQKILNESHRGNGKVIYDKDPKKLVARIIEMVKKEKDSTAQCPGCI